MSRDKIRKLSDREQAREKISVFFGSADNYVHGLKEVMANATDEIINNFDSGTIYVKLMDDNKTISVRDTGRGIPIDGETDGEKDYDLLFRTLFAGTKYGDDGITDGAMTGTNGVGVSTLNFTSLLMDVTSVYGGKKHHIQFKDGGEISKELSVEETNETHGTTITFKLDPEVYTETTYTNEQVKEIIQRYAVSSSKITIEYTYGDEQAKYHYDSVGEYFKDTINSTVTSPIREGSEITFTEGREVTTLELSLATTTVPVQESYLNLTHLPEGGAINDGIINGFKLHMSKYCRDNNMFPRGHKSFSDADIEESLSFVAVMMSNRVEFSNQTKMSTKKKTYREVAKKYVIQMLIVMEIEDKKGFDEMVKHLLLVQKDNTSNQKQKEKLKKKLSEKVDNMANKIEKFVDCRIHGEEAELYLAEGDSAHGSVVLARDGKFQASLPMGGKFLNVAKASSLDAIVNNEIVMNVIKVLGCGVDLGKKHKDLPKFDINRLRYGKIICASDEDPDGAQIQCLIITLFHKLMPEIITSGKLYIAQTPLYEIKMKDDSVMYAYTDDERNSILNKHRQNIVTIARSKGLGELSAEVMAETAMNPATRHLVQIKVEDANKAEQSIQDWMGNEVANRKEFISENLNQYVDTVID